MPPEQRDTQAILSVSGEIPRVQDYFEVDRCSCFVNNEVRAARLVLLRDQSIYSADCALRCAPTRRVGEPMPSKRRGNLRL